MCAAGIFAAACLSQSLRAETTATAELQAEYERLTSEYAQLTQGRRPERPATGSLVFVAPDQYSNASKTSQPVDDARREHADALYNLAKRAADGGQLSFAFQWATEAIRENPDHEDARRVLGYEQRDGKWLTRYGAKMFDSGKTWHPKYGWVAPEDVARYDAGERQIAGRWVLKSSDGNRRLSMADGWNVRTDHFQVTTNHSLEAAAELAARLERLHQVWRQLFAGFYLGEREVGQLFAGERDPRGQPRPFRVFYHRDRDDYVAALKSRQPRIGETLGIYFDAQREAHFFAGAEEDAGTLYHEAVHQLFQESRSAAKRVGGTANFWIIEGVACYFETLTEHRSPDGGLYFTVGEGTAGRLPGARERLKEGSYVPLAELLRLGKSDVQQREDIAKLYSQSAGLTALLIDGEQGRYREPLVQYLEAVYAGRDDTTTLENVTGASCPQLDDAYRRFMESLP